MTLDTSEIIHGIRQGKSRHLTKVLYKLSFPPIVKYIRERGGRKVDAEDAFQEALIVLVKKVYDGSYDEQFEVKNFLFVIAKNKWLNKVQRDHIWSTAEIEPMSVTAGDLSIEEKLVDEERQKGIWELMNSAGERCRRLLELVLYERKKFKEIAQIMDFSSEEIVKTTHYRCKQKLKAFVKEAPQLKKLLQH